MRAKMKYTCKKFIQSSNQEMFAISLSSCSRYNANFKSDQSVSAIHDIPPCFWDQWWWPPTEPLTVTHARAHWWTLDLANAFVSPGVNSGGELVPSHGASRRRLGEKGDISIFGHGKSLYLMVDTSTRSIFDACHHIFCPSKRSQNSLWSLLGKG